MSPAENKELVRHYFALTDERNLDQVASNLLAPGFQLHFGSGPAHDAASAVGLMRGFLSGFPDMRHTILDQVAEGDQVATRLVIHGTNTSELNGMPPTGREATITAINIHRIVGDRIVEQWVDTDLLGMMQQLGAIPAPAAATT